MAAKLLWLGLAGALGTLARYGLVGLVNRVSGISFPWGTVVVNLTGCFAAGLAWAVLQNRWPAATESRTLILVGFMGAFTTFSAVILETGELARTADWMVAAGNIVLQNGVGLAALFGGIALGRLA